MDMQNIHHDALIDSEYAIKVTDLVKKFGDFTAVSNLNFYIKPGEIFGFVGPNGSGKTTTLNMISGLSIPTSGKVSVFGLNPRKQSASARRLIGVVPQETALYEDLTAERNLNFHAELFGIAKRKRASLVAQMLELVQLGDRSKSRVSTFSGGMKRRLAIARALLHEPKLIFLDEPTLGVDVQSRNMIWDYIQKMRDEGRSVLLTTNYLEEANRLCDRIAIIDHGQLVALDNPTSLKTKYGNSLIEAELNSDVTQDLVNEIKNAFGIQSMYIKGSIMRISLGNTDSGTVLPRLLHIIDGKGFKVQHITLREPSLDEVFIALTGKGLRD